MAEIKYWLWLSAETEVSVRAKAALLQCFGDPETAYKSPKGSFSHIQGIGRADASRLEQRNLSRAEKIPSECRKQNIRIISMEDPDYPQRLKNIYAPPVVLYVQGKLPNIDDNALAAVIGTRKASNYGLRNGVRLAAEIVSCGGIVVSGLTAGVDAAAAEGALLADGICIAVLGTPHEKEKGKLAQEVLERGAVVSEYPPGAAQQRSFFRDRNRIAAGLSLGVVVVEAPAKSNTRLFALEAIEQGKDVFALPGNVDSENSVGTNSLLREGAKPALCGWDILSEYAFLFPNKLARREFTFSEQPTIPEKKKSGEESRKSKEEQKQKKTMLEQPPAPQEKSTQKTVELNPVQQQIVSAIGTDTVVVDDIIEKTGLSTPVVLSQLTILEIRGVIRREPGKKVALKE